MGTPDPGLRLTDVVVGYRSPRRWPLRGVDTVVVADINARAEPGTVTAVLGPNGAGKSTLLRSLMGLQPLLAGSVTLAGDELDGLPARERARRSAVVLTDRVEVGLLTGREVAELGRHPHHGFSSRLSPAEHRLVDDTLQRLHAEALADRRFSEMSDGQRQRILLARALVQQPELLLLDEPSAFLDVGARVDLMALLQAIAADRGITVVLSTHEVELALRMGDALWLIDGSRLSSGTADELIANGEIGRVFETAVTHFDPGSRTFQLRP
ncbi:hypothetical protein GCM10009841_09890 [Microlunatus panaciterrae]|uniref:Iron complex transport system ATP-binding protein n=1 Tax=Microlunatus panaciterrae TaxID=400768 RepID=A0ABS2RLD9_9ACTN|nr:ABC transporter ATP-binding protein [Microlunatus panaciterrae]MBM7799538.1 iron complex transport system ATP-binding protein [Microlunatus panaciterrae]